MKKFSLVICSFLVLLVMAACNQVAANEAIVTGSVSSNSAFETINVVKLSSASGEFVTTQPINSDGSFSITLQSDTPEFYNFEFKNAKGAKSGVLIGIKPGDKIKMKVDAQVNGVVLEEAEGSEDVVLVKKHRDIECDMVKKLTKLQTDYSKAADDAQKDSLKQQYMTVYAAGMNSLDSLLSENTSVFSAACLAYFDFSRDVNSHRELLTEIHEKQYKDNQNNPVFMQIDYLVGNPIVIGKEAPELEGKDAYGNVHKLSDLRGKYVLVDFWASWCRPCRMENPNVVAAYDKYHDKGFEVFSVSLDKDAESWKNAIIADGLKWENHISSLKQWNSPEAKKYRVNSIPFSLLLDKEGKIIATGLRGSDLHNALDSLLK